MLSRRTAWIFGIGVVLSLLIGIYCLISFWPEAWNFSGERNEEITRPLSDEKWAVAVRVIDGDTIELEDGERVRYVGVNAPESVDPRRRVECFGKEASAFNKALVEGKKVRLERDVSDRDTYGRLLRFVFLEDGIFVNEVLVREGYAYASPYAPDISMEGFFRKAESDARKNERGLWREDTCNGKK